MRLFIAEKPSMARAIAQALGSPRSRDGYIETSGGQVTWCVGHILEQAEPEDYDPKYEKWRLEDLPIVPETWKLKPIARTRTQLQVIKSLLAKASEVINAGDAGREGQLLVDEVLIYLKNNKPVRRLWLRELTESAIKKALAQMKDNRDYEGLYRAALARQRVDWLVGMNLTRACTVAAQEKHPRRKGVLSIGRVQTPTLALVVRRDQAIRHFQPVDYFTLSATFQHAAGTFTAAWSPGENQPGLDSEGRLLDRQLADSLAARLKGQRGVVAHFESKEAKEPPPLPFSLSSLQIFASKRWGYGAKAVLDAAQSLYEAHKLTTYPRSDCEYLADSQLPEAAAVLQAVAATHPGLAPAVAQVDTGRRSRAWNDQKVGEHHGIIPTAVSGNVDALSAIERNLYDMIARRYLAQFYPDHRFLKVSARVDLDGETFVANGRSPIDLGWKVLFATDQTNDDVDKGGDTDAQQTRLPTLRKDDPVHCNGIAVNPQQTKPPPAFTEGLLIEAMEAVHRFVDNPNLKSRLKETSGIGTVATRAAIIETLFERGYIERKGKQVASTALGQALIAALPVAITDPGITALWEDALALIETGKDTLDNFVSHQVTWLAKQINKVIDGVRAADGMGDGAKILASASRR